MTEEISSGRHVGTSGLEWSVGPYRPRTAPATKLSINEMTTCRWSFQDDVLGYREAGIEGIGVWRPKLARFGEERGIELLRETGLTVSSLSWAGGFTGANGQSFDEAIDDARDAIRLAAALNADCLVIASGPQNGHIWNHARRLLVAALQRLGDFAAGHGVTLALKPMHAMFSSRWSFMTTLDQTLDVLGRCDHPAVRMAFDAYQLWQEPRLLERIAETAPQTALVQLSDWGDRPRSDYDRRMIGDGRIPLGAIARAFLEADYDGCFEIEIWSEEVWQSNYNDLLRDCRLRFEALCR